MKKENLALALFFCLTLVLSSNHAIATTYSCANCLDCENYILNSSSSDIVQLSTDITNVDVNCINITSSIDGVTFDCHGYNITQDSANQIGIYSEDSTPDNIVINDFTIKGCTITADVLSDYGIYFGNNISLSNLVIENNTIDGSGQYAGISISNATGFVIKNNHISNINYSAGFCNGILLWPRSEYSSIVQNGIIDNNTFVNLTSGIESAYLSSNNRTLNVSIWNNVMNDIGDYGLQLGGSGMIYSGQPHNYGYIMNNTVTMRDETGIPLALGQVAHGGYQWSTILFNNFTGNRITMCYWSTFANTIINNFLNLSNSTPVEVCPETIYTNSFNYSGSYGHFGNYWTNWSGDGISNVCSDVDDNGRCDNVELNITSEYSDYLPLSQYSIDPFYDQDPPDILFTFGNGTEPDNVSYIVWTINSTEDLLDLTSATSPYSNGCNFTINGTNYIGTIVNLQTDTYCYYNETGLSGNVTRCAIATAVDQTLNVNTTDDTVCRSTSEQIDITSPVIYVPINTSVNYQPYNITVTTNEPANSCWWECESVDNTSLIGSGTSWYGDILPSASQGNFRIEVRCNDSSGNEGYNDTFWLIYDWTAPNQTILLPENTTYYTNDTIYWNVTFSDTYSSVANAMCISTDGNVTYTCEYGTALYEGNTTLSEGFYNWTFRANDTAGNYDWNQVFFTVLQTPTETLGDRYPFFEQLALIPVALITLVGMTFWFWGEVTTGSVKDKSTLENQAKKLIIGAVGVVIGIIALLTIFII